MKLFEFKPKLVSCLKNYSKETFMADLMAGIIVGIVALPLAIAFGIASGVSPEKGIITAIIAGFIISLLGGSKVQIGGPTGAFIVIIYGIIQQYGEAGLIVATLMAGVLIRSVQARSSYQVHPLSYHRRIYQWYRCHYFHDPNRRYFRTVFRRRESAGGLRR